MTGGTGSFGQTMVRRMLADVRVLSRDEGKHDQMRVELADPCVRFYVGDVRDYLRVERRTAATSTWSSTPPRSSRCHCEFFPVEAVAQRDGQRQRRAGCGRGVPSLVFLSTDKAVYPINAMGMTKAMMEKVALSHGLNNPHAGTVVSCVRYGNVMYSRGSVIPLFVRQLTAGITSPAGPARAAPR